MDNVYNYEYIQWITSKEKAMIIEKKIVKGRFLNRPNRFQAYVELEGESLMVAVPNTGRCREILIPGTEVLLREGTTPTRKTPYDLIAGYKGDMLINIDSQVPNKVVEEALLSKKIKLLRDYNVVLREKFFNSSRFDFKLQMEPHNNKELPQEYFLEVKGVTLEEKGVAMFPDAPTIRGARHLRELVEAKEQGYGAGVLFLIQMEEVKSFSPHDERDPLFGEALRYAKEHGVQLFAYNSIVTENSITLDKEIQIIL